MNVRVLLWILSILSNVEPLREVETLYYRGSYTEALEKVEEYIKGDSSLDETTVIELRKYAAFSLVALGKTSDAGEEFRIILSMDSSVVLDPELVSPKIIEVFDVVKKEFDQTWHIDTQTPVNAVNSLATSGSLSLRTAALSSFAFPGLGQMYLGEKTKGWLFITGEGLSLGGLIISQVFMDKAHEYYLAARDTSEMDPRYKVYNNWFRARNAFGGLALGIWISAPLDVLFFPPSWAKNR